VYRVIYRGEIEEKSMTARGAGIDFEKFEQSEMPVKEKLNSVLTKLRRTAFYKIS
jgi:hypothetical protein